MLVSNSLLALVVAVVMVTAEYDADFCKKRIGAVDDTSNQGQRPTFQDNFYVFMEMKRNLTKVVAYMDEYYSQQAEMMYGTHREKVNQTQFWVDAHTDEIMSGPFGSGMCVDAPLEGSTIAQYLGVTEDSTGNVELNTPEVTLGWDKKFQRAVKYMGSSSARGMKTLLWNVCSYIEQQQTTTFTEWHIVDPTEVVLPIVRATEVTKPILPIMANVYGINKTNPANITRFGYRIDFTFFDTIQSTDPIFQIPPAKLCQAKPSAQIPLPVAPSYFKFKGEQITITNPNTASQSPPDFLYTVEQYIRELKLFIQDTISTPTNQNSGNDKSYTRVVNDYSTGLSFQLDLVNGQCIVAPITSGVDSVMIAGGNVQMRNSQQFFDLDSNQYQYMGIHKMRGIDCDTWSAFFADGQQNHMQNSLYTWYFANPQWLKNNHFQNYTTAMPVTLEIQQNGAYIQYNFYEFDTLDSFTTPDMSLCFNHTATLNIELFVSARYDTVVAPSHGDFDQAVYVAVVIQTSLNSILSISDLDVQPASNDETLVRFKLLDMSTIKIRGDVSNIQPSVPNSKVYQDLEKAINSGTFSFDVQVYSITGAVSMVTVYARPGSLGLYSGGEFVSDSGSSTTAVTNTLTPATTGASTGASSGPSLPTSSSIMISESESSGVSPGAVAGISISMLILGVIIGVTVFYMLKRFRPPRDEDREVLDMKPFSGK